MPIINLIRSNFNHQILMHYKITAQKWIFETGLINQMLKKNKTFTGVKFLNKKTFVEQKSPKIDVGKIENYLPLYTKLSNNNLKLIYYPVFFKLCTAKNKLINVRKDASI